MATLYLPLGEDVEIRIELQTRFYNGIHSDPRTLTREPSLPEVYTLIDRLRRAGMAALSDHTKIDYPSS